MMRFKALTLAAAPVAAVAMLAPQAPVVAQASSPLTQVTAHLKAVNTMVASFRQTDRKGRALTGTMTLKRPGKLRFQYQKGVPMLIVADGRKLNMIDYETGRVDGWPINDSPLSVLLNPNQDLSRFARVTRNDAQVLMIEARDPRRREFGIITIRFVKSTGAPAGLVLQGWNTRDAQNNLTTVRLSNQRFNVPVADAAFRYREPTRRGPRG